MNTVSDNAVAPLLSVVIPVYNEEDNVPLLIERVSAALSAFTYELIIVDDGSSDNTHARLLESANKHTRILAFTRNFGQTAALAAGIDHAMGTYIVTMDGDLQNDPDDIAMMLTEIQAGGHDIVAGCRADRADHLWRRKIPSRIANWMLRKITRVDMADQGCAIKIFRAETAKRLELYGELHRFIAILAVFDGADIKEVPVNHHARRYGVSKYGLGRILRVISDMMLLLFLMRFLRRPMHLFGALGVGSFALGMVIELYMLIVKTSGSDIGGRPLFFVGIFLMISGIQLITTGFLAELLMRTYYGSGKMRTPYVLRASQ